jgi:Holliday junction resolvase RusA-like endonuclease
MIILKIKPLSVNEVWQGKRFKTKKYKEYEKAMFLLLPKIKLPTPPYQVFIEVGFSSVASDLDNIVKPFIDILQKKYDFNDSVIYSYTLKKKIVKKGHEYIMWNIETN